MTEQREFTGQFDELTGMTASAREEVTWRRASRMIDALTGIDPNVGTDAEMPDDDVQGSSLGQIPTVRKGSALLGGGIDVSLGRYFCDMFNNEKPADVFNAGFIAGVLAVGRGLVNPQNFNPDSSAATRAAQPSD